MSSPWSADFATSLSNSSLDEEAAQHSIAVKRKRRGKETRRDETDATRRESDDL